MNAENKAIVKALEKGNEKILKQVDAVADSAFELGWTLGNAGVSLDKAKYLKNLSGEDFKKESDKRFWEGVDEE